MSATGSRQTLLREFHDNALLQVLFGPHNVNLERIERGLGVALNARGNTVSVSGSPDSAAEAGQVLDALYDLARRQGHLETADIDAAIRMTAHTPDPDEDLVLRTRKRHIAPRTPTQADYLAALQNSPLVFGLGPAGTGKTYLAVACAVDALERDAVKRLILVRPAVEAGEKLGFLPGDLVQKVDPYLRPLYDALYDLMGFDKATRCFEKGIIEIAPLAFMRGRTLNHSFVILDEAQNTSPEQMKMFLTRIGFGSKAVITGDPTQIDLPRHQKSGLIDAQDVLADVRGIALHYFTSEDVVRHPLVQKIVDAYERQTQRNAEGNKK